MQAGIWAQQLQSFNDVPTDIASIIKMKAFFYSAEIQLENESISKA